MTSFLDQNPTKAESQHTEARIGLFEPVDEYAVLQTSGIQQVGTMKNGLCLGDEEEEEEQDGGLESRGRTIGNVAEGVVVQHEGEV